MVKPQYRERGLVNSLTDILHIMAALCFATYHKYGKLSQIMATIYLQVYLDVRCLL